MCDYSLREYRTRLGEVGDALVAHKFPSSSVGFIVRGSSTAKEAVCATCIAPYARLLLANIPLVIQRKFGVKSKEEVTFIQTSMEVNLHRDAIRFLNGSVISLQCLENVEAEVLSLGEEPQNEPATPDSLSQQTTAVSARRELVSVGATGRTGCIPQPGRDFLSRLRD